ASRDVISHLQRVENVDFMFQENSQLFELQRLRDMKRMLSEYVAAQLTFHAKAMENLSAAAQALGSFDPDAGMDVLGGALAANRAPHSPEEEAPSSTDHARSIMDSIPRTGLLPAHVTRRGFEAGGVAPSRGVTFEDAEGQDEEGPPPTLGSEGAGGFSGGSQDHPADSARSGGSGAFLPPDDSPGAAPAPPRARTQGGPAQVPPPAAVPAPAPSSGGGATAGQEKKPGFFKKWFGGGGSAGTSGTAEASTARPAGEPSATAAASSGSAHSAGAPSPAPAPAEASAGTGIDSD
ncbi:Fam92a, partial [Symbiodinium sp. KB8]